MTLAEIVSSVSWPQLKAHLLWIRADVEPALHEYQKVLGRLNTLTPVAGKMRICIEGRHENDGCYVRGRDGTLDRKLEDFQHLGTDAIEEHGAVEVAWGLWLTPWVNWLGMEIADETTQVFSPAEIAAHCLLEMTFLGFAESAVEEFSAELARAAAERDAMTEEEKASLVFPLNEVVMRSGRIEE